MLREEKVTRFAPSPTGPLHLGHAYAALIAAERAGGGRFLLRIEDIDRTRSRKEYEAQIFDDLYWLGLSWAMPVIRQSERLKEYRQALEKLAGLGVVYPCHCRRADIRAALAAPQEGVTLSGPDGPVYPGLCRGRSMADVTANSALRLDMQKALSLVGHLTFSELGPMHPGLHSIVPDQMVTQIGDVALSRRDMGTSYHLSVVVDDAAQGITEVTRGSDLFDASFIHVLLRALLQLPPTTYYHHDLIRDQEGKRLAKRDDARAISYYRTKGATPQDIKRMIGL